MDSPAQRPRPAAPPIGAVLAGGRGSRIGGAKALAPLAGRPLISYALAAVAAAGLEPVVVAKRDSELPPLDCHVIHEPAVPRHPLRGIVTALRHAGGRPLVACGCDMPFVTPELLAWLAAMPRPLVVVELDGFAQPLPARYDASLLPALEAALERSAALRRTVAELRPHVVGERELARFGDPRRLLLNVNDPADLVRAERLLRPSAAGRSRRDTVPPWT